MKAQNFFNPINQKHLNLLFSIKTRLHSITVSEFFKKETWVNNPIRGDGMVGKGKKPIPFRIKFDKVLYAFISFILLEKYRLNSSVRIRGAATSILLAYPKLIYKPRP